MKNFIKYNSSVSSDFFDSDIQKNFGLLSNCIKNKKILVIGGAGTIGSNYIKQILSFKPNSIFVVDHNENGLTELTRDLRSSKYLDYNPEYLTYPVNLLSDTFERLFEKNNFDIISNFSALKHVRSEKDIISVEALIKNNIYGAIKLLELCLKKPPKFLFSVSTDKATNPVNIMGASKLIMEKIIISHKNKLRVSTARFANVSFSNGSLLDGFTNRLKKSQPLSCPEDIKRFFVSEEQSGKICLLSTFLGESGDIFFPKLDSRRHQIYFKDIAINFLENNGYEPIIVKSENEAKNFKKESPKQYPILMFKSDTSGEKKFEEFYSVNDNFILDDLSSLGIIKNKVNGLNLVSLKNDFDQVFKSLKSTKNDIIKVINKLLPNFNHIEKGKNLDSKM